MLLSQMDKETVELVLTELEDFQQTRAFHLLQEKLSSLKDQALRLAASENFPQCYRHQGEVTAYSKAVTAIDDFTKEVRSKVTTQAGDVPT